jgi:BlaI family transcriptional regulator, penicillinase repressor
VSRTIEITDAEALIMEALWEENPIASEDIIARVAPGQGWSDGTVRSLLNRLLNKKALAVKREGRRYWYRPLLKREAYLKDQSESFLGRLFDGRLTPFVTHLSEHQKLSKQDIADLRKLIDEYDK